MLNGASDTANPGPSAPPWGNEIQFETLAAGTFALGGSQLTFYATAFFHAASKSLIVTDALAQVCSSPSPASCHVL